VAERRVGQCLKQNYLVSYSIFYETQYCEHFEKPEHAFAANIAIQQGIRWLPVIAYPVGRWNRCWTSVPGTYKALDCWVFSQYSTIFVLLIPKLTCGLIWEGLC
jgi:hypothetical protein